jgi:GT2 family glycosyltransferase
MEVELSVIIVNYNGLKHLKGCLDSLYTQLKSISFEILLLDNHSSDGSCDFIKMNYPKVQLIQSTENLGFSKGNNKAAQFSKGKNIALINADTVLLSSLSEAVQVLEQDSGVGIIGYKMLDEHKNYRKSAGHFPSPKRLLRLKTLYFSEQNFDDGNFSKEKTQLEVDWVEGSLMVTTKEIWNQVGGLDETYFMYVEDIDFCKKVSLLNKKIIYLPHASYIHFGGFTSSKEYLLKKGLIVYSNKFFNGIQKKMAIIAIEINQAIKKIYVKKTT